MTILEEAQKLVLGDRNDSYGSPLEDYQKTAKVWSGLLIHKLLPGIEIEPREAILMMAALKLSREMHKHKRDNLVDAAGYILCEDWAVSGVKPGSKEAMEAWVAAYNKLDSIKPQSSG